MNTEIELMKPTELFLRLLKNHEINGEELEQLIRDLGMEDQMLRQLALKADMDELKELIEEKEELETNKTDVYCVDSFTQLQVDLMFKGTEYRVAVNYHCDDDKDYIITYLDTNEEVSYENDVYDEIVEYVSTNIEDKF
jgi:hypothetical protein